MDAQDFRSLQEAYMEVYSNELYEAKIDDNLSGQKKKDIRNKRSKFGGSSSSKSKITKLRHYLHNKHRGLKKIPGDKSLEKEIAVLISSQRMHGTLPKIQKIGGPKGLPEQTDIYDIILSHLLDEGYAETPEAAEVIMVNMSEEWRDSIMIDEGMDMKTFKANRKKTQRAAATADARKRGHEGSEWHNTGRTYGTDEAKSRRANLSDTERSARHGVAVDPDSPEGYGVSKTKNPRKFRKQQALGEH